MGKGLRQLQKKVRKNSGIDHRKVLVLHGLERPVMVMVDFKTDEVAFQMQGEEKGIKAKFSQMLVAAYESMQRSIKERANLPDQIREAVREAQKGPPPEAPAPEATPASDSSDSACPVDQEPQDEAQTG